MLGKDNQIVEFEATLATLNREQRKAVEAIDGPVMVIAGPGTGKTQILTLRIANILLKTDSKPENILALTFTESGAKAMRDRLRKYIGAVAYKVPIFTFHGFAQHLINTYPDAFPRIIGGRPATDIEKVKLLETILKEPGFKLLKPLGDQTYYVSPLITIISQLKQEYVSADDLQVLISKQEADLNQIEKIHQKGAYKGKVRGEYSTFQKVIEKNKELQVVYRLYESALAEAKLYDFDDMISETVKALKNDETLLRELQETYHYILADEHQDVNGSQNKILEHLANFHDNPNIFVVGDEKQAIYRFQGASLSNFLYFTDIFPKTTTIALTDNYRSGQEILDFAQELIKTEDQALVKLRVPLVAKKKDVSLVEARNFSHQAVEDDWVVTQIKDEIKNGTSPEEIAVIVRTNREVETLATLLRKVNVPVTATAESDILEHPITLEVEALIGATLASENEESLFKVIQGSYWGLSLTDTVRIVSARSYDKSLRDILNDRVFLQELGVQSIEKATAIMTCLERARDKGVTEPPHRVLDYLLVESGFIKHVISNNPYEGVRVVRRLYDEIEAMVIHDGVANLSQVKEVLKQRRHYRLPLSAPYIKTTAKAVQVMTAHKSKGLEFSTVFIPHLHDANWGKKTKGSLFKIPLARYFVEDNFEDDEKRLLYVAVTRAKERLFLSRSEESIQGKAIIDSRLLTEELLEKAFSVNTDKFEKDFDLLGNFTKEPVINFDTAILKTLISTRGLSATSLNNLLKNPWDFLFRNILRVPEVQPLHMQFGTAIHNVLQAVTAFHTKEKVWPDFNHLKNWLEIQLHRLPIHTHEFVQLHEKGLETLVTYLEHLKKQEIGQTREEVKFKVTLPVSIPEISELSLTGKFDRLDFAEDGQLLRVIDYKTGKPKSRASISGETKSSDGGYKRQLIFYALLLSLYEDQQYQTREGVLSFVEADQAGKIREEFFTVTDQEIVELKSELIEAVQRFCAGDFLTDKVLAEASEYKDLALNFFAKSNKNPAV